MKKLVLLASIVCFAFTANATISKVKISKVLVTATDWMKSKDGTWQEMKGGKTVWYKLNAKDARVWMSMDGKKWDAVKDGMWQDKDGKWLKIDMKMLK